MTDERLHDALLRLADPDPEVRVWAVVDLRRLGDSRAISALLAATHDDDFDVVREARRALCVLDPPDDMAMLFHIASEPYVDEATPSLVFAMYDLLRQRWEEAVTWLAAAISTGEDALRMRLAPHLSSHCYYLSTCYNRDFFADPDATVRRYHAILFPALVQGLRDPLPQVRAACVFALQDNLFPDQSIVELLLPMLTDDDPAVRRQVIRRMWGGNRPVFEQVESYLHHPQAGTRAAAIEILPYQLDATSREAVLQAANDLAAEVRIAALTRIYQVLQQRLPGKMTAEDMPFVTALGALARDDDAEVRAAAAEPLNRLWLTVLVREQFARWRAGDEEARTFLAGLEYYQILDELNAMLQDEDGAVRAQAVALQLQTVFPEALRELIDGYLRDVDRRVRRAAADGLLQRGPASLFALLLSCLDDLDSEVAALAHDAQQRLKAALSREALEQALHDLDPHQCEEAVQLLRQVDAPWRAELLAHALQDDTYSVVRSAIYLLDEWREPVPVTALCQALANALHFHNRDTLVRQIVQAGDLTAVPLLLPYLRIKHYHARYNAIAALTALTNMPFQDDADAWEAWWKSHD